MKWFKKLEFDTSTVYNYIDSLSNKVVTPTLMYPLDLRTIPDNIQKFIPKYLNLPNM